MKTIGLCMIVKNEAPVVLRCLKSVRPLLDYVLIADTGSEDGTQEIIRTYLREEGLAGEVVDEPWSDFATNRSSVLSRLRERSDIDYALIMDADDTLSIIPGLDVTHVKENLSADLYNLWIRLGPLTYHRPQICSNRLPFRYRGVLHEFLEGPAEYTSAELQGVTILCDRDGARSRSPHKYTRDAEVLERALASEEDPLLLSRYTFYLAQSYRDQGKADRALGLYLRRAQMGFWDEERFISLYEAGKLKALLGRSPQEVIGSFLEAYEICPTRAKALHGVMQFCRNQSLYHQGFLIGQYAVTMKRPQTGLFLENWIYDYGLFDEFSVLAYWSGHYEECRNFARRVLEERRIPEAQRDRVAANVVFAEQQLRTNCSWG